MKIALAQIDTTLGNIHANLEKHLDFIHRAKAEGADLVVFPELSLTGYILQDIVPTVAARPEPDDPIFKPLLGASKDIDVVLGFVEADARHRFFIAGAYLSRGEVLHVHRKIYLPTYGLFDEGRFFAGGDSARAFDTPFGRLGLLICEDFWHASLPYLLWMDGADLLIFISASPGHGISQAPHFGSAAWVEHATKAYANIFTCFVASVNRIGYEDAYCFYGSSHIFDPQGELIVKSPSLEEALTFAELDLGQLRRTRVRLPLLRDERPDLVLKELEKILGK
ncbi:MAG: nitrilase-related carbon-nitrogen hydrolase [Anaerolineales bacterium]|jgi:predicted amidohydrolase